jgi:hypothetical protein
MERMMGSIIIPAATQDLSLTQILKKNLVPLEKNFLRQVEKLLETPPGKRKVSEMEELESLLLLRNADFEKFNESERQKICQFIQFDFLEKVTFVLLT